MTCGTAVPQQLPLAAADALSAPRWANTTVLSNEVAAAVCELKSQPGRELPVHGGGTLIRWLLDTTLVDDLTLLTVPVVIDQGTRLSPDAAPDTELAGVESRSTPSGVMIQVYQPTGCPQYGTATADMKHVTIDTSSERRYDRSDRRTLSRGDASDAAVSTQ